MKELERALAELRRRVEFDRYDFSPAQQDRMLMHIEAVSKIVYEVKSKG